MTALVRTIILSPPGGDAPTWPDAVPGYAPATGLVDLLDVELVYALTLARPRPGVYVPAEPSQWEPRSVGDHAVAGRRSIALKIPPPDLDRLDRFATEDFTTAADDPDLPNKWFDGRIIGAGEVSRSVRLSPLDSAAVTTQAGAVRIANADGALDEFGDDTDVATAEVNIDIGRRGAPWGAFQRVATCRTEKVDLTSEDATINFTEYDTLYDAPFNSMTFAGTGDLEGPPELADSPKPVVIGSVFNIQPVLIDAVAFVFMAHTGVLRAVTAARYGGLDHAFTADYADIDDLRAAPLAVGEYATCLAFGLVRMGLTQGGVSGGFIVTLDCEAGEAASSDGAVIAAWIATAADDALGATTDEPSWAALAAALPGLVYGRFLSIEVTWRDLMEDVMRSIGAHWGANRSGLIAAALLQPPDVIGAPELEIDEYDVLRISRLGLPDGFTYPHSERTILFGRNWSPTGSVAAAANAKLMAIEWREKRVGTPIPGRRAVAPPLAETGLLLAADAEAVANRLLELHGVQRAMFSVTIPINIGMPGLLTTVNVTFPRFGLDGGRRLVVVATTESYAAGEVTLTLWG
ncbi:MAG: hypothetical protein ACE37J_12285 [Pikeienuella sp.]|uniref:hypothetical protein n=1 Tax=Pikeienuella sp. TaxID=2831957 RepID=UPI00391DA157